MYVYIDMCYVGMYCIIVCVKLLCVGCVDVGTIMEPAGGQPLGWKA